MAILFLSCHDAWLSRKIKGIPKGKKKKKTNKTNKQTKNNHTHSLKRRVCIRTRHSRELLELSDQEFKTNMINVLTVLMGNVESRQKEMGTISRETETTRKKQK